MASFGVCAQYPVRRTAANKSAPCVSRTIGDHDEISIFATFRIVISERNWHFPRFGAWEEPCCFCKSELMGCGVIVSALGIRNMKGRGGFENSMNALHKKILLNLVCRHGGFYALFFAQ
jgi:hypothetical protein